MRLISFQKTLDKMYPAVPLQIAKTETRRLGFWNKALNVPRLKVGEVCWSVERTQGLKKGEKIKRVWPIIITGVRREPLCIIDQEAVIREGFSFKGMTPPQFIDFFLSIHKGKGVQKTSLVTVIQFDYLVYRGRITKYYIPRNIHAQSFKQVYSAIKSTEEKDNPFLRIRRREFAHNYWLAKNWGVSETEFNKYQQIKEG